MSYIEGSEAFQTEREHARLTLNPSPSPLSELRHRTLHDLELAVCGVLPATGGRFLVRDSDVANWIELTLHPDLICGDDVIVIG